MLFKAVVPIDNIYLPLNLELISQQKTKLRTGYLFQLVQTILHALYQLLLNKSSVLVDLGFSLFYRCLHR